jgi:hypothetical protein
MYKLDKKIVGKKVTLNHAMKILNNHPDGHKYDVAERKFNTASSICELLIGPFGYKPKTHIIIPKSHHNLNSSRKN